MQKSRQIAKGADPAAGLAVRSLLALPVLIATFLALSTTPALAAQTHRFIANFGESTFANSHVAPKDVAVDEATGNVAVVTNGIALHQVVFFGLQGGAPSGLAVPTITTGPTNLESVAIDNSATSLSRGAVYVSEWGGGLKKFVLNPISEEYELEEELSATPALNAPGGFDMAVDSKGDLFAADPGSEAVVEFDPTGNQIARLDVSAIASPQSMAITIDAAGDLFVRSESTGVYRFDANGAGEIEAGTEAVQIVASSQETATGSLAVDLSTNELYAMTFDLKADGLDPRVEQFDGSCTTVGEGKEEHCSPSGQFGREASNPRLAVNSMTSDVYIVHGSGNIQSDNYIAHFGPNVIVPSATTAAASAVAGPSATLNGSVDPSGSEVSECRFEWGESDSYGHTVPCAESPAEIGAGNAPVVVHADLSDLDLGREYHFRLVVTSATTIPDEDGPSVGVDKAFATPGPQVGAGSVSGIGDTTATLEGLVNAHNDATSYVFEYVSQADFEADEYALATSQPLGGEEIGSGNADVAVVQAVGGLQPGTVYHFRIAATNAIGTAHGPDRTFVTYSAITGLPDGRAYEQVSPVDKNGVQPRGVVARVQAAADGSRILYFSHGGIPGSEGAQKDPLYLSSRGSDWSTQGLMPPASAGASAAVLGWSEDLSQSYLSLGFLPGDRSPASFLERDSAGGSLRAIVSEEGKTIEDFNYVGASAGGAVVAFESATRLSPGGTTKGSNLYVWDRASGELSLAGVLNNGSVPSKGTLAGSNELPPPGTPEGSYKRHFTQAQHTLASDGSAVFFSDANSGQLYARLNPTQSQSEVVGSECTEPELACTVQLSASQRTAAPLKDEKPAVFWGATPDGSAAFFTSPGQLTDDVNTGPDDKGNDLYRYDVDTGDLTDLTPDATDPNGAEVRGVLGASTDGSYVYFAANGVLTSTPNGRGEEATLGDCSAPAPAQAGSGACNLYLAHDGAVAFVARLRLQGDNSKSDSANWFFYSPILGENTARVATDGRTLLFRSQRALGAYDSEGTPELYRYEADSGHLDCVSCNPVGAAPVGPATLRSIDTRFEIYPIPASVLTRNLSTDGSRVFFESLDKLVASDTDGDGGCPFLDQENKRAQRACQDVYEWEAKGTGSCQSEAQNGGCLYLLSTGTSTLPSYFGDASASGDDAFVFTDQSLVGQDKDRIVDIYDARVGGGIASQNPPPPAAICLTPEACRSGVAPPLATQSAGSASFSGPGNQKPVPKHKKRHHKKQKKRHRRHHASRKHG